MRKLVTSTLIIALLLVASVSFAQVRGRGRLQGQVTDKETGKPVAGAKVTVALAGGSTEPIVATTDAKGRWSALGLVGGQWNIDIEREGYLTSRGSANISELQMLPPVKTALTPAPKEVPAAPVAPVIPPAAVDAVNEAQDLMKAQVGDVITRTETTGEGSSESISHTVTEADVRENSRRAAALLEGALPAIPADTPEMQRTRTQIQQLISQAHYKAGDLKKAIESLEQVVAADPANSGLSMLLVNLYLEDGRLAEGKALVDRLPADAITDPTVYTNVGILFMNKESFDDALTYFTRAIDLDRARAESYYYRGLAYVQAKKFNDAKADFNRVVELAPDSPEAEEAKELLAQIK